MNDRDHFIDFHVELPEPEPKDRLMLYAPVVSDKAHDPVTGR